MQIRRMMEADVPDLTHIVCANYSREIAESFADEMLATFAPYPYRPTFYTAIENDEPIGCAGYVAAWLAYGTFTLSWVNVAKQYQGYGHGRALVDRCLRDIKAKGTFVILATSVPEFYSKNWGFKQIDDIASKREHIGTTVMSINI